MSTNKLAQVIRKIVREEVRKEVRQVLTEQKNKKVTSIKELGTKNFKNIDKIIINKFLNTFR